MSKLYNVKTPREENCNNQVKSAIDDIPFIQCISQKDNTQLA